MMCVHVKSRTIYLTLARYIFKSTISTEDKSDNRVTHDPITGVKHKLTFSSVYTV